MSIVTVQTLTSKPRPRFHTATPLAREQVGATIVLPDDAAHHAVRVLRLGRGATITLFDGRGGEYAATIVEAGKRESTARIDAFEAIDREPPFTLTLVQAVIAADAMDYAVRKAVEVGASSIAPVTCARSAALDDERAAKRVLHWRGIAIAACEQCGRNRVPAIAPVQALSAWLDALPPAPRVAMAAPGAALTLAALARKTPPEAILVGPEGGFTDDEQARAVERGVVPVGLGPRVLRAETAGVVAIAMLSALIGDAR